MLAERYRKELEKRVSRQKERDRGCARCGNMELNWDGDWWVSDEAWKKIVPEKWQNKTLCPWCFVELAKQKGKPYRVHYISGKACGVLSPNSLFW